LDWHSEGNTMDSKNIVLNVNGIEVIYNHVILVLKGVSLQVAEGSIVAILGGNGAGKTTTLRAISNLLKGERGEVTKGSIELRGERIENLSPADLVKRGVVQVMEGRHCFAHLTIEENLMTGSYTRTSKGEIEANLEKVYNYFPRLKTRRTSQAAYTSGGEQQMCAIGRALMANPSMVLLDEPSMGLAPQIVEEVFNIVKDLNTKEKVTFLAGRAEHQHGAQVRGLRLHHGKRPRGDGRRRQRPGQQRGRERVLPGHGRRRAQELQGCQELQAAQALVGLSMPPVALRAFPLRGTPPARRGGPCAVALAFGSAGIQGSASFTTVNLLLIS
jgi:branched-chain amino acid transport system ATP-binding protein